MEVFLLDKMRLTIVPLVGLRVENTDREEFSFVQFCDTPTFTCRVTNTAARPMTNGEKGLVLNYNNTELLGAEVVVRTAYAAIRTAHAAYCEYLAQTARAANTTDFGERVADTVRASKRARAQLAAVK